LLGGGRKAGGGGKLGWMLGARMPGGGGKLGGRTLGGRTLSGRAGGTTSKSRWPRKQPAAGMSANITSSDCIARNRVSGVSARALPVCASKIICKRPVNGGGPCGTRCSGKRAAIKLDTVELP